MAGAFDFDLAVEWFESFTEQYDGPDASIRGGQGENWARALDRSPQLTVFAAYQTPGLTSVPANDRRHVWQVDHETTRQITDQASRWCQVDQATTYFLRQARSYKVIDPDVGLALCQAVERHAAICGIRSVSFKSSRQRMVNYIYQGLVAYQLTDAGRDWRHRLAELRNVLLWDPAATDLAFVRYGLGDSALWDTPVPDWPHRQFPALMDHREVLAPHVLDVHGMQLLTDKHLQRAGDLANWKITRVATTRYLVEAQELDPWYAEPEPDPDARQQGLRDFGEMVWTNGQ